MSVQVCEGVWRNRSGQRLVITQCEPDEDGQQWTDGGQRYSDNGSFYGPYGGCSEQDLVEYIGLLPDKSQPDQQAKIELLRATLTQQTAEIDRLRSENNRLQAEVERLQTEIERLKNMDYVLNSTQRHAESLERLLDSSREALRELQEDHTEMDHRAEGARSAYLGVIKALWEMRR